MSNYLLKGKVLCSALLLGLLDSCDSQTNSSPRHKSPNLLPSGVVVTPTSVIDYKKSEYKLFIGQTKDSVDEVVELRHDYLTDDGIINDNGVTHYLNINEGLLKMSKHEEVLPALFFTTNKKHLTAFSCSIIFSPDTIDKAQLLKCLTTFSTRFTALKVERNRNRLANEFKLDVSDASFREIFELDTTDRKYNVLFNYEKSKK